MKTTLFYWVFRQARYVVCLVLTLAGIGILMGGYFEGLKANIYAAAFMAAIPWSFIIHGEWKTREKVRGLIADRIDAAERQWMESDHAWMDPGHELRYPYLKAAIEAEAAARSRPDLWGEWTLNVYNGPEVEGVKPAPFATGNNDLWPRWVFEPVKG